MKTLKSIIIACLYIIICTDVTAKDLTGVRIYINPGHGGFDAANDRNVVTIPYAANDKRFLGIFLQPDKRISSQRYAGGSRSNRHDVTYRKQR